MSSAFADVYEVGSCEPQPTLPTAGSELDSSVPCAAGVVLPDPVDDPPQGVLHTVLPGNEKFRHRYTGLRLLAESDKCLFLVPASWSPRTSRTLMIENSADIRLQLVSSF
ncbi:hypothetical protein AB0M44_19025 [Streptosporangium subroseum]|uniref:hypothetical protein n=1 Tax=Streptosporangium subroseum TaxID=106412 RepID=UPI00342D6DD7